MLDKWDFFERSPPKEKGWKIYVSCTAKNFQKGRHFVSALTLKYNYSFKSIHNISNLVLLNDGHFGYSQIGKNIVIYFDKFDEFFLDELITFFSKKLFCAHPQIPFANRLIIDTPLFYRWGSYTNINDNNNERYADAVPPNIDNLLEKYILKKYPSRKIDFEEIEPILLQFPVIGCLCNRGKSGVFLGLDFTSSNYREVIIKVGYLNGGLSELDNVDGLHMIQNEHTMLIDISRKFDFVPNIIDFKYAKHSFYLILEKIDGVSISLLKQRNQIDLLTILKIYDQIEALNNYGIIWGDAKLSNMILNVSKPFFVDFETACYSDSTRKFDHFATYRISNYIPAHMIDKITFLLSVLEVEERYIDTNYINALLPTEYNRINEWATLTLKDLIKSL